MPTPTSPWMDLLILERKRFGKLNEIVDLTQQLAQALDREDQVSVRLLLKMRREPILALEALQNTENEALGQYPAHAAGLLKGALGSTREEMALAAQAAQNQRLSQKLLELDGRINRKLGGKRSYFAPGEK